MTVRAMKAGALEFLTKPFDDEDLLQAIHQGIMRDHRAGQQRGNIAQHNFDDIVGTSAGLRAVLEHVQVVAPTDSTVLINGETGTGKELVARAIHKISSRSNRAFVKLNCAAIPSGLLESELFGHEKGAFTGAVAQKIGRFELANGGTLFLDEVGDIPLELQPKLLRVLQEQEFERLGSTRTIRADVRLVAATNRDLVQLTAEKQFREDLYFRLNVFPIRVPLLREREGDIPLLVRHYVCKYAQRMNKQIETIPEEIMAALCRYSWPGNVRELQNLIERAVILTSGKVLRLQISDVQVSGSATPDTLEDVEREHILQILRETNGVVGGRRGAAVRLGLPRTTLMSKMDRLGILRDPEHSRLDREGDNQKAPPDNARPVARWQSRRNP
jgi:formate hydrogenlyase transcriptional activator